MAQRTRQPQQPKWVTPKRQAHLAQLAVETGIQCLQKHTPLDHARMGLSSQEIESHYVRDHKKRILVWGMAHVQNGELKEWGLRYGVRTVGGVDEDAHLYTVMEEEQVAQWVDDDRNRDAYEWHLEQMRMHDLHERGTFARRFIVGALSPVHNQNGQIVDYVSNQPKPFDPVTQDQFFAQQPLYYFLGFSVDPLSHHRVAAIRIASTFIHLYINVEGPFQRVSINKRKKLLYGGAVPEWFMQQVRAQCATAVHAWRKRKGLE